MAVTIDEIDSFRRFAIERVRTDANVSLEDLVGAWRLLNPTPEEHAENIAAIRSAIRDMDSGDHGRPAIEIVNELRRELESAER